MSTRLVISSQVQVFVNGSLLGQATAFRWHSSTADREGMALDSLEPYELIPSKNIVTGSCSLYRMIGDGGLEGQGITARFEDILRQKYITLTLKERFSDAVLFEARQVRVSDQSWDVSPKGLMHGSFNFKGIAWGNEVTASKS